MMSHSGERPITVTSLFNSINLPARSPATCLRTAIGQGSQSRCSTSLCGSYQSKYRRKAPICLPSLQIRSRPGTTLFLLDETEYHENRLEIRGPRRAYRASHLHP